MQQRDVPTYVRILSEAVDSGSTNFYGLYILARAELSARWCPQSLDLLGTIIILLVLIRIRIPITDPVMIFSKKNPKSKTSDPFPKWGKFKDPDQSTILLATFLFIQHFPTDLLRLSWISFEKFLTVQRTKVFLQIRKLRSVMDPDPDNIIV